MYLSARAFNSHLRHMGQQLSWRKGFACPCINVLSGQPRTDCALCAGKGRTWGPRIKAWAGVPGGSSMKEWKAFGLADAGDCQITVGSDSPMYDCGQFDRVSMINRSEQFSMNVVHGTNELMHVPMLSVDAVYWVVDNARVNGGLPSIDINGGLTWWSNVPPEGVTFSITGRRMPEYFVYDTMAHDRPEHYGEPLPRRLVLRRFDLWGR